MKYPSLYMDSPDKRSAGKRLQPYKSQTIMDDGHTRGKPPSADKHPIVSLALAPEESVGYLVRYAFRAFENILTVDMATHGILTGQFLVLRVLWIEEGLSQSEVAKRMNVERASLTSLLVGMEDAGIITRVPDTEDRRKVRLYLTLKGRQSKRYLLPVSQALNEKATKGLTSQEIDTLKNLLSRIIENLNA